MDKYCDKCGSKLSQGASFCSNCANPVNGTKPSTGTGKSKVVVGLLAIFLGSLGIHNFYLGYKDKAMAQLLLTVVGWTVIGIGPIVSSIWALVEGIQIFTGSINKDADGVELVD